MIMLLTQSKELFALNDQCLETTTVGDVDELLQELRNTDATTGMQRRTDLAARGVNVGASAVNSANAFIRRAEGKGKATGGPRGGFRDAGAYVVARFIDLAEQRRTCARAMMSSSALLAA